MYNGHMETQNQHPLPQWAPRVKKEKIRQLYELDALGMHDGELLDEVGWNLAARCESFITACQACKGSLPCPVCGTIITHQREKDKLMHCDGCGWERTWGDYFQTIQHKQLSGAGPVLDLFAAYIRDFDRAQNRREKMLAIDRVLHGFHYWITRDKNQETRPTAINLIDGRLSEVIDFLDQLTYGDKSTPGTREQYEKWHHRSQFARSWPLWNGADWITRNLEKGKEKP